MNERILFVISAPSGCGKTTMVKRVMKSLPELAFSISHTTRPPRSKERDGQHYYFINQDLFQEMYEQQPTQFLEWAEVHGNYYGTSRAEVERLHQDNKDVILDIDTQGAKQVMEKASPVSIFVAPPSLEELEKRLRGRNTEDEANIQLRMENAKLEMAMMKEYEYVIINDVLEDAVDKLISIITAERCRSLRLV